MADREKLIELLDGFNRDLSKYAGDPKFFVVDDNIELADHLIANGVTVQEWISVKDRLPEERDSSWAKLYGTKSWQPGLFRKCSDTVNACAERKDGRRRVVAIGMYDGKWDWHKLQDNEQVTHWMPLPPVPKGD